MIMRSLMFLITLAMKFKADFIDTCLGLVSALVVARKYLGFSVCLAGRRGKAANLVHVYAFADVIDHISDEWSSRLPSSAALPVMAEGCATPRRCMENPIPLAGRRGEEADPLHDDAFADALDHNGMN